MLMYKPLNFIQQVCLQNFLIKQSRIFLSYNLLAKSISTRNHMFGRVILEIAEVYF